MKGKWDDEEDINNTVDEKTIKKDKKDKKIFKKKKEKEKQMTDNSQTASPCRSVDLFRKIKTINEGTYGIVYKAQEKETGEVYALKRLKVSDIRSGILISTLREVKFLLHFNHPNIVRVKEVLKGTSRLDFFIVMEYLDYELRDFLQVTTSSMPLLSSEIKTIMYQLLKGISYLHEHRVIHRDIKTGNILLSKDGFVKIADFGTAREIVHSISNRFNLESSHKSVSTSSSDSSSPFIINPLLTAHVTTPLYCSPEIFFGSQNYTAAVDIFSLGCIMAELYEGKPLLKGRNELEILNSIISLLGHPNEQNWPGFSKLPDSKRFFPSSSQKTPEISELSSGRLRLRFSRMTNTAFNLFISLLSLCPDKRITAKEALNHPFFKEEPLPLDHLDMTSSNFVRFLEVKEKEEKEREKTMEEEESTPELDDLKEEGEREREREREQGEQSTPSYFSNTPNNNTPDKTPDNLSVTPVLKTGKIYDNVERETKEEKEKRRENGKERWNKGNIKEYIKEKRNLVRITDETDEIFDEGFISNASPDTLKAMMGLKKQWKDDGEIG